MSESGVPALRHSNVLVQVVDSVIEARWPAIMETVERIRKRHPDWTERQVADEIKRRFRRELSAVGAASGCAAAVPGVNLVAGLGVGTAELGVVLARTAEMVLGVAVAFGHTADDVEQRRAWLLAVLGLSSGGQAAFGELGKEIAAKGGVRAVKAIPVSAITSINRAVGGRILVKWGTKAGVVRLGTWVPMGIGIGLGAAVNAATTELTARAAIRFFDDTAPRPNSDRPRPSA